MTGIPYKSWPFKEAQKLQKHFKQDESDDEHELQAISFDVAHAFEITPKDLFKMLSRWTELLL